MQSIDKKVLSRIYGNGRGWCFALKEFSDIGSNDAIRKVLSRLGIKGTIKRLARGLYLYPKTHKDMGTLAPSPESVARALAVRGAQRIQPTGAYAANLLGLTTQVPAKIIFLTDGPNKMIQIGNQRIQLKHTTTRRMAVAGHLSGLVFEAFRFLGKDHISDLVIKQLRGRLDNESMCKLLNDISYAPIWMEKHIKKIANGIE